MKASLCMAVLGALTTACSVQSGFEDSALEVEPRLFLYTLSGDTTMQSVQGGIVVDNPSMPVSTFGLDERSSALGFMVGVGDGFAGGEFLFERVELKTTKNGTLTQDWGDLQQGMTVNPEFLLNEYEVRYIAQGFDWEPAEEWRLRLGFGASIIHHDGYFEARDVNSTTSQQASFSDDGMPYLDLRGRVEHLGALLQVDYGINPDWTFGGDFDGVQQIVEITGGYTFETQKVSLLAGYRWEQLKMAGREAPYDYRQDFELEGWVFGIEMRF